MVLFVQTFLSEENLEIEDKLRYINCNHFISHKQMKNNNAPLPIDSHLNKCFFIQHIKLGEIIELPISTNWMKIWRYITLELDQSSVWFLPNFNGVNVARVLYNRWPRSDIDKLLKGDYIFYAFNSGDIKSLIGTICLNPEMHKKDWLIIKSCPDFSNKNRALIQRFAIDFNIRVILLCK